MWVAGQREKVQTIQIQSYQQLIIPRGFGVTEVTGMKVNVICEAVEVILRFQ